jgi:antitoxin MazE
MTTTTIQKWGNSFAVRIPKSAIDKLRLQEGQTVTIQEYGDGLSLVPTKKIKTLKELVSGVTKSTLHRETEWGGPVGKELW